MIISRSGPRGHRGESRKRARQCRSGRNSGSRRGAHPISARWPSHVGWLHVRCALRATGCSTRRKRKVMARNKGTHESAPARAFAPSARPCGSSGHRNDRFDQAGHLCFRRAGVAETQAPACTDSRFATQASVRGPAAGALLLSRWRETRFGRIQRHRKGPGSGALTARRARRACWRYPEEQWLSVPSLSKDLRKGSLRPPGDVARTPAARGHQDQPQRRARPAPRHGLHQAHAARRRPHPG